MIIGRSFPADGRDFRDCFCEDGFYPNEAGHRIIADSVLAQISNIECGTI